MAEEKTLFQKIMDREEPGEILYEDDQCVALRDINPQAPTHVLIVPRKPIPTLDDLSEQDEPLVGHLFLVAQKVAADEGLTNGYRTVFNNGSDANQTVAHIHLHLIGGRKIFCLRAKDAERRTDGQGQSWSLPVGPEDRFEERPGRAGRSRGEP